MKRYIKCIYLVWRRGRGDSRIKIGEIRKNQTNGITFKYLKDGLKSAMSYGFTLYPDFPDPDMVYRNNVIEIFGQRLNQSERSDIKKYYDYWEIDPNKKDDRFYVLAQTQGLLSTDNFEFIADYYPIKELRFTSEICGLSNRNLNTGILKVNDELKWKLDKSNAYDKYAVRLFKDGMDIGYVKIIHNIVFHDHRSNNLKIKVKSLEQNGHIKRAFIVVNRSL